MIRRLPVVQSDPATRIRQVTEDSVRGGVLATARAAASAVARAEAAAPASMAPVGAVAADAGEGAEYPRNALWNALREVDDPEFPVSVVDLGLVVEVRRDGGRVEVDMTYTATACPCMDFIRQDVRDRLLRETGVSAVIVTDVWQPAWTPARMTEEGRAMLRRCGVAA